MSSSTASFHRALLVVDVQPDFLPGGSLAVESGDQILPGIRHLMTTQHFGLQVATQDWHPPDHVSFASNHPGSSPFDTLDLHGHEQILWPDHCVQGTDGAELVEDLPWERVAAIVRKGMDPRIDSYSGFRNNWAPGGDRPRTGLAGYLSERGITDVFVCGLARDVCVRWTVQDAVEAGFATHLLWDLTRSVDPSGDEEMRQDLADRGIRILDGAELEVDG